jgi:serine/threonine-protein kinase RsbW/sigma-B regulation protein RsbU (phosphoserine phosphatase)
MTETRALTGRAREVVAMAWLELHIENRLEEIGKVADAVERISIEHAIPQNVVNDMSLSLDEVLNNIISYAYVGDVIHTITVRLTIANRELIANIDDDGQPFNPLTATPPDLSGSIKERAIGGLGIQFVKTLMDQVGYVRRGNQNCLELRKNFVSTSSV